MMLFTYILSTYLNAQVFTEPEDVLKEYQKVYGAEQQTEFGDIEYIVVTDITPIQTQTQRKGENCEKTVRYTYQIAEDLPFYQFYKQPKSYGEIIIDCVSVFEAGGKSCVTVVDEYTYAPTKCELITDKLHSLEPTINQDSRDNQEELDIENHNQQLKRAKPQ